MTKYIILFSPITREKRWKDPHCQHASFYITYYIIAEPRLYSVDVVSTLAATLTHAHEASVRHRRGHSKWNTSVLLHDYPQ